MRGHQRAASSGRHGIAGIGPGFVAENYNPYVVDTVLTVSTADAERAAQEVLFFDGVPACASAGATLAAAVQLIGCRQGQAAAVRVCGAAHL